MDSMQNARGDDCPLCGVEPVVHQAVSMMLVNGAEVLPQCYAICDSCHKVQYEKKYGYLPEDAHRHVLKRKKLISDELRFRPHQQVTVTGVV